MAPRIGSSTTERELAQRHHGGAPAFRIAIAMARSRHAIPEFRDPRVARFVLWERPTSNLRNHGFPPYVPCVDNKSSSIRTIGLAALVACSIAFGEESVPIDSLLASPTRSAPLEASVDTAIAPTSAIDSTTPPLRAAAKPQADPNHHASTRESIDHHIALMLDLSDLNADKRTGQRHFHRNAKQTNYCCFDAAWSPIPMFQDWFRLGPVANFGGWIQNMESGPATIVSDLVVGGNIVAKGDLRRSGPWARTDLGLSLLAVTRKTTGIDFGLAAALRVGWAFSFDGFALIVGAGTDTRQYLNLDVHPITAATLSAGVML